MAPPGEVGKESFCSNSSKVRVVAFRNFLALEGTNFRYDTSPYDSSHRTWVHFNTHTPGFTAKILLYRKGFSSRILYWWGMVLICRNFWDSYDFYQIPRAYLTYKITKISKNIFIRLPFWRFNSYMSSIVVIINVIGKKLKREIGA